MPEIDHRNVARIANIVEPLFGIHGWKWADPADPSDRDRLFVPTAAEIALCVRDVVTELAAHTEDGSVGTGRLSFQRSSDEEGAEVNVYLHLGTFEFPAASEPADASEAGR
jgi:hypothetical protein